MKLYNILTKDLVIAMKNKDNDSKIAINAVKARIINEIKNVKRDLTDIEEIVLVKKEIKELQDTYESEKKAGRDLEMTQAKNRIALLEKYLPKQLSENELDFSIDLAIDILKELGGVRLTNKDMGKVIKIIMAKTAGRADGSIVSKIVKSKIGV